jgi:hypothetical protein
VTDAPTPAPRSTFVTAVAWVFIALAGFVTLIAVLQNIMVALMFPREAMSEASNLKNAPMFFRTFAAHPQVFVGAFLALSATTFASAIGLLKRKNWARLIFIAILALGIVWNLGSLAIMFLTISSMPPVPDRAPPDFRDEFETMWKVMMAFSVVIALSFAGLFGWIIKRLVSVETKREFLAL